MVVVSILLHAEFGPNQKDAPHFRLFKDFLRGIQVPSNVPKSLQYIFQEETPLETPEKPKPAPTSTQNSAKSPVGPPQGAFAMPGKYFLPTYRP